MPTPTYTPLATITLGSATSSVVFSSIPATYRDLVIVFVATTSTNPVSAQIRFNSNTSNYNWIRLSGNGSTASTTGAVGADKGFLSEIARTNNTTDRLQIEASVLDYAATNKGKSVISRASAANAGVELVLNQWVNTSAITSVNVFTSTGNWSIGSTFSLYGIAA
jgi:hypothetical protein